MFDIGQSKESLGNVDEALYYYERSLATIVSIEGKGGKDAVQILLQIGKLLYESSRFEQAQEYLLRAYDCAKATFGQNHVIVAGILNKIGNNFYEQKEYTAALDAYRAGLSVEHQNYLPCHVNIAMTLLNVARIYQHQRKHYDALKTYNEALYIEIRLQDSDTVALILSNMGLIYEELGRNDEAADAFDQTVRIYRHMVESSGRDGNRKGILLSSALNSLGLIQANQRNYDEAILSFLEALAVYKKCVDTSISQEIVPLYHNLATVYKNVGNIDKALEFYKETLRLEEAINDTEFIASHKLVACLLHEIGALYTKRGEYNEALHYLNQATRKCIEHPTVIGRECGYGILMSMSHLLKQMEDFDKAMITYTAAVGFNNGDFSFANDVEGIVGQLVTRGDVISLNPSLITSSPAAAAA